MPKHLYKYVGPGNVNKVFASTELVTLKCSFPKDFNDPYELFLTIDFNERPEVLAFYMDAVGKLPQLPTTCFSKSLSVVPMWAHYAQNLEGFALEFDEELLSENFPESGFGDVDYRDSPDDDLTDSLYRAYEIGKPRYVYFLNKGVFSAAYYTKTTCWSYEQERRMIVRVEETRKVGDLILMDVPKRCLTAIVCGSRSSPESAKTLRQIAMSIGCDFYTFKTGRSSATPFFVDAEGSSFTFNGVEIARSAQYCASCKEPLTTEEEHCSWCQIDSSHEHDAATRNPFRILSHYGMLGSYIEGMEEIGRKHRKK
ncbi:MAG: hypothetical protein FD168_736 [Desulfobulbaceae bacterium]|nr:MAG: hypothetical protein FD168_736 [Desulfobulbaceae bacterium]